MTPSLLDLGDGGEERIKRGRESSGWCFHILMLLIWVEIWRRQELINWYLVWANSPTPLTPHMPQFGCWTSRKSCAGDWGWRRGYKHSKIKEMLWSVDPVKSASTSPPKGQTDTLQQVPTWGRPEQMVLDLRFLYDLRPPMSVVCSNSIYYIKQKKGEETSMLPRWCTQKWQLKTTSFSLRRGLRTILDRI